MKKNICGKEVLDGQVKLLDSLKDLLIVYDMSGALVYVNDTVCRALGYSRAELLSKHVDDIVAAPYGRMLPARVKRLKKEGELFITTAYKKRSGGSYPAEVRCNLSAMGGRPCVICMARPMAGGQKAAGALGETRERYRRLIEGLKDEYFFYQHGLDGVFSYVSPSVLSVLGYSPENFLKHYTRYLTDNPENQAAVSHTKKSIKGRQQPPYRIEIRHKSGTLRWLEVLEVPVRDELGCVISVEGIAHDITARVKSQGELAAYRHNLEELVGERTAELKAIFDRTPVLMILLDEKFRVIRTNAASHSGSLMGEVLKCINAADGDCGRGSSCGNCLVRRAIAGTLRSGRSVSRVEANIDTSGRKIHFLLSTALIKTDEKKQLLLCLDDITSQKEAEESLRKAEEFRRLILSSVGDGIIGVDNKGRILFMNEAAQAMLGWSLEELRGKNLHSVIHNKRPDGRVYPVEECPMFAAYSARKESVVQEEMLWRRDGSGFYVRYSARPMFSGGEVSGAVITFSDVSERRRIEKELLENKERLQTQNAALTELGRGRKTAASDIDAAFRAAVETAASAIGADKVSVWLFNEDRSALVCRTSYEKSARVPAPRRSFAAADYPAYFRLLESERLLVIDDAASDFRVREFRDSYIKPFKVGSILDISIYSGEKTAGVICAERLGPPRPWRLDEQNMLGAVADFAALALAGAERIKLERMKEFLTQTIVHDLKNPLFSIILAGHLLSEDAGINLSPQQKETLGILNSQAEEMKRMVSNILDISRIEEGKLPIKPEPFVPLVLLRSAADSLRIAAANEKKRIKVLASGLPERLSGDTELLRRVIENLIANALKFSPEGASVEAGGRLNDDAKFAEFHVKDSGPGIPEEHHSRIFDKFVQLEDPGPRKWGGKGLGLAFCKLAVEAHGGRIWVESTPGHGSVFRFTLPLAGARAEKK